MEEGRAAVEQVTAAYGDPDVMTRTEYIDDTTGNIDAALGLIYVLLALAIIIALMGIANTLALAVYERTSELGILRAVGTTRPQVRAMVRWEAVIVAVFGTLSGIAVGVFLGWALFRLANVADRLQHLRLPDRRNSSSSSSSARSPACSPACARPGAPRSSTCCKRSPRPEPNVGSIEDEDGGLARHTLQRHHAWRAEVEGAGRDEVADELRHEDLAGCGHAR